MRYMLIVKATSYTEAGITHKSTEYLDAFALYKNTLAKAGMLLAAERLEPSSSGIRIKFPPGGGALKMQSGPFPIDEELIVAYVLIEAASEAEALEWARQMPLPPDQGEWRIELRRLKEDGSLKQEPRMMAMEADLMDQLSILQQMD